MVLRLKASGYYNGVDGLVDQNVLCGFALVALGILMIE